MPCGAPRGWPLRTGRVGGRMTRVRGRYRMAETLGSGRSAPSPCFPRSCGDGSPQSAPSGRQSACCAPIRHSLFRAFSSVDTSPPTLDRSEPTCQRIVVVARTHATRHSGACPLGVKLRRTQSEQTFSGMLLRADWRLHERNHDHAHDYSHIGLVSARDGRDCRLRLSRLIRLPLVPLRWGPRRFRRLLL
jgi:hypothetical protein